MIQHLPVYCAELALKWERPGCLGTAKNGSHPNAGKQITRRGKKILMEKEFTFASILATAPPQFWVDWGGCLGVVG